MYVSKSQRVQTSSTVHLHIQSCPDYEKSKILEGVYVSVRDTLITVRNHNQQAVTVNRTMLAPEATRHICIPVQKGWYPPVFMEIIAYETISAEVERKPRLSTYSWSYRAEADR